ncbi:ABC transporter ATP-binding protein [Mesorhizobium sp.]|uniref:ABC transporter ATP-binding protein n=1 Tax=Mesorhizobium sp. TaxID=1871066 RepID=UPI000FE9345C|nr:ABC transporter ATP-binding protein [Mesorhizobium sp.]RWL10447.1 MAG: ABC transporter ATP-binding protein [Mesorhizobium sp.]
MVVLSTHRLGARFGSRQVLRDVTLPPCHGGEVVAVIGPNAAGKSTLFRRIAAILPGPGDCRLEGVRDIDGAIAYMPQDQMGGAVLTVFESVLLARKQVSGWRLAQHDLVAVDRTLTALDIGGLANEILSELSGGPRQLVGLAQCLAREPRVLLLDEPTSALDMHRQLEAMRRVRSLARDSGMLVLIALHDLNLALKFADKVAILSGGTLHDFGPAAEVLTPENLAVTFRIKARVEPCSQGKPQLIVDDAI